MGPTPWSLPLFRLSFPEVNKMLAGKVGKEKEDSGKIWLVSET
jgi:hypothetical protein